MRLHNSTDISSNSIYRQRSFIIRYQQPHSYSTSKKNKIRFSQNNDNFVIRSCIISQTDAYKQQREQSPTEDNKIKKTTQIKTQRLPRRSFKTPTSKIGSVADLVTTINNKSLPTTEEHHDDKDFPRIPIQYNDEKINGVGAQSMRLKIIYRGYAPKNTYYYLKSLAFNQLHIKPSTKRGNDYQLQFQSKFQSGNLAAVARKSQRQFYIFMREDTNSFGLRQWYYFCVTNKKQGIYKFRIYKFSKFYSLYKEGMKPFVRVVSENGQWMQMGQNIKYQYQNETKSHFLEFQFQFTSDNMTIQMATQPPYTYTMLRDYMKLLLEKYPDIKIQKAGQSLAGLDIPKIQIITKAPKDFVKKVIIVIARTHPGQTASNWTLQAFIERIYQIPELRIYYDFYIIPMVNPDGVFLGNHRTGVMGQDINRNFSGLDLQYFPEVQAVQKIIQKLKNQKQKNIEFLLDLHGHSAKKNIFAFGDEHPAGSHAFLLTHILPKLLNDQISSFKYESCVFRASKQKKNTARVYFSRKYKINAITFEQSYGLLDNGVIGIQQWKNFGVALANALKQYFQLFSQGSFEALQNYLYEQIQLERDRQQKRLKKKIQVTEDLKTQSNLKKDTIAMQKFKTQSGYTNAQFIFKTCRLVLQDQIQQKQDDNSINSEQLSSGDEQLQNNEQGMELLKKQITKIGCQKQGLKREIYSIAQRNIQIRNNFEPRLHEQRSSMVPRILKFQMKKRQEINYLKYHQQRMKKKLNSHENIELPNLKKQR